VERARVSADAQAMRRVSAISCGSEAVSTTARPEAMRRRAAPRRTGVDHDMQAALGESLGDGGIALGRPALGAQPAPGVMSAIGRAGLETCRRASWRTRLRLRVDGKSGAGSGGAKLVERDASQARCVRQVGGERVTGDGRGELQILLDHVRSVRDDALGEEPLRGPLARRCLAMRRWQPLMRRYWERIASLKVEDGTVAGGAELWRNAPIARRVLALNGWRFHSRLGAKWRRSTMGIGVADGHCGVADGRCVPCSSLIPDP